VGDRLFSFSQNKLPLGVELGSKNFKLVDLKAAEPVPTLNEFVIKEIADQSRKDIQQLLTQIQDQYKLTTSRLVLGISGEDLILGKTTLPQLEEEELKKAIKWEFEDWLPLKLEEVTTDYQVINNTEEEMEVLLAAARRERVLANLNLLEEAGFEVVSIAPGPLNLSRFLSETEAVSKLAVLDIGFSNSELICFTNGKFSFHRSFKVGGKKFTAEIKSSRETTYRQAANYKLETEVSRQLVVSTIEDLIRKIKNSFKYYQLEQVDRLLLTGGGSNLANLASWLENGLGIETGLFNLFDQVQFSPQKFDPHNLHNQVPKLALVLGLALRGSELSD
jgi:type IV pilus assembly protein PilM